MMFLRNCWYVAAFDKELPETGLLARTIIGEPLVFYRRSDGQIACFEDRCVHRLAPLSRGRLEGDRLRCMYHGFLYEVDGRCVEIPGQTEIPAIARVRTYPAVSRHGWIWIWPGDREQADPDLIPGAYGLHNPEWILPADQMIYDANYMLLNNNLCDLGHLSFVHVNSFGADMQWIQQHPKITSIDRGVRFERWVTDVAPIPPLGKAAAHERVDIWSLYDFLVPGLFLFYNGLHVAGSAKDMEYGPPPREDALFEHYTQQSVTPIDERRTLYTFCWGPSTRLGTAEDAEVMTRILGKAFYEDKDLIEAQQRIIDCDPARSVMPTAGDKGVVKFNLLMSKLIGMENSRPTGRIGSAG